MRVRIEIVPPLTQAFGRIVTEQMVIEKTMASATLADLLNTLIKEYTQFGEYVLDCDGVTPVCPNVMVALNGKVIPVRNNLALALRDGDVLQLLPEFVGG